MASMVAQAYPTSFTPVNVVSGFKKVGMYPFNPSEVDDRQLAPSTAFQKKPIPTGTADEASCGSSSEKADDPPPVVLFFRQRRRHCSQCAMKNTMISPMIWSIMHG